MATSAGQWASEYEALISGLAEMLDRSRITLCGMGACIDARINMHDMQTLLGPAAPQAARAFADLLLARAGAGIGGEFAADWQEGPTWLVEHLPTRYALGGTGPQAAWVLAAAGAPAAFALEDRSPHMLAQLHPDVLVAQGDGLVPAKALSPKGERRPDVFIFEYTAGQPIGTVIPPRSSRIIVRFSQLGLQHDESFDRLTPSLAAGAGAGLVSGFNSVDDQDLDAEIARVFGLAAAWRRSGLDVVMLELAGYDNKAQVHRVVEASRGAVSTIGMSHSEFLLFERDSDDLIGDMCALAERIGVDRVIVHADHWAASVSRGSDKARERRALMMGCLLAGNRAATGIPCRPAGLDPKVQFHPLPYAEAAEHGRWSVATVASPYLDQPVTTLGLGDSFTAGCLLALGLTPDARQSRQASTESQSQA